MIDNPIFHSLSRKEQSFAKTDLRTLVSDGNYKNIKGVKFKLKLFQRNVLNSQLFHKLKK